MRNETIVSVANMWSEKTYDILDLREIPTVELEDLLRDTYCVLYKYHTEKSIPKEVCQMLLNEDEFMSFLAILGGNQDELEKTAGMYQALYCIIDTMKQNFFCGEFKNEFPILQVNFNGVFFELNMDEPFLKKMA